MPLTVEAVHMDAIVAVTPQVLGDSRALFLETIRSDRFQEIDLPTEFVQENHTRSSRCESRGLHFQWDPRMMRVTACAAFLVAVDVRKSSPTLDRWCGLEVSAENEKQMWAPQGFAHSFCSLTDGCEVQYKGTGLYIPQGKVAICGDAAVSNRDRKVQALPQWLNSPLSSNINYHSQALREG